MTRFLTTKLLSAALLALPFAAGLHGAAGDVAARWKVHDVTLAGPRAARATETAHPVARPRAQATWCGTPAPADLQPNVRAGYPVHWIYAVPADGEDRSGTIAGLMQTDAETIDAWWSATDSARLPRNDLAALPCGERLDISVVRLPQSGSDLGSVESRFPQIANTLIALGHGSRYTKYVVYYDGPVEPYICGQGGSARSGLGYAVVYVQACFGVPASTTAVHELLHTMGAVPEGAPGMCPAPDDGHVCDDPYDVMFPFGDETPLSGLSLDTGRNDYYAHGGSWPDIVDSPWLTQLDRQVPLTLTIAGPGSVSADVPGLACMKTCTTSWNDGTQLALAATAAPGAKLVGWRGGCSGTSSCTVAVHRGTTLSALFAPSRYRLALSVAGKGGVRSSTGGVSCPGKCSAPVPSYTQIELTARPAAGWRLKAWSGACRGSRPTCRLPMSGDSRARAIFVRR
jgi:Divergent InlB B-repeat domain